MSFPRYPEYKDSGVEWLGEVPQHWTVTRTKHICQFGVGWTPPTGDDDAYIGDNLWANISDLGPRVLHGTAKRISDEAVRGSRIALSPAGSLLFSFKLSIGQVSIAGADLYTNEAIATFLPSEGLNIDFAYYAFPEFLVMNAAENIYGAKLLNQELLRSAMLLMPPSSEQTAIAAFLDRETGKIDALVAEQEKLIALLKEKRQAVISHAVTKGLDPNAPMKPSGIEWLGDVPAHWEVKSMRHIVDAIGDVDHFMPTSVENGIPYLMTGDLRDFVSQVRFDACKKVSQSDYLELSKRIKTEKGDVVMARYATIGTLMYIDIDVQILVSYSSVTLKAKHSTIAGMYLFYFMKSEAFRQGVEFRVNTNTQANVGISDLLSLRAIVPPLSEQATITIFLGQKNTDIDALIFEAEGGITLLKERRAALISAAVTGKIDVRGFAT